MLLTPLLSLIAPHDCIGCQAEGAVICGDCRPLLQPAESRCYRCQKPDVLSRTCPACAPDSPLHAVYPAVRYRGLAKDALWKLKAARARAAARELGDILATSLSRRDLGSRSTLIVTYVPTATTRVRQRGYDQSALIARACATRLGARHLPLLRRRGEHRQVGADRETRLQQQQFDFRPINARHINGARILLIDDVITTGATLETAAGVLMRASAARVDGAVFAQA